MWQLNLAPQQIQYSHFKHGGIKFQKRPAKWSDLPLRCTIKYFEGEYCPLKYVPFDPGSRQRIVKWMKYYHNFEFSMYTDKGNPSVDPEDLADLSHEGALLVRYLKVVKDLGQISAGEGSIINALRSDSTVKSRIDQNGASATGRFTSSSINLNQIPSQREFRELFSVPDDSWVFIGTDFSGQENVALAEWLYPYDNGKLWDVISKGSKADGTDLHSINAGYCGVSRADAKSLFFAYLYGSSPTLTGFTILGNNDFTEYTSAQFTSMETKLLRRAQELDGKLFYPIKKGKLVPMSEQLVKQALFGKQVQDRLVANTTGLADLIKDLQKLHKKQGYVETLGGRKLYPDSPHKLLNYASQGQGAEAMKYYIVTVKRELDKAGLIFGKDYVLSAIVYDEQDYIVKREHMDTVVRILDEAYATVSSILGMKTTFTGETLVGSVSLDKKGNPIHNSWYGCH